MEDTGSEQNQVDNQKPRESEIKSPKSTMPDREAHPTGIVENVHVHSFKAEFHEQDDQAPDHESTIHAKKSQKKLYARVESRMASGNWDDDTAVRSAHCEVETIEEAEEYTLPLFFGGFSRTSTARKCCFAIMKSMRWSMVFASINLASCIYIAAVPEIYSASFNSAAHHGNATSSHRLLFASTVSEHFPSRRLLAVVPQNTMFPDVFEGFCVAMLTFEVLVWCIAVGLVRAPSSYLRASYFHQLDFSVLAITVFEYVLLYSDGMSYVSFRAFRLLRLLQLLLRLEFFREVKEFLDTLSKGVVQLLSITTVLFLFLLSFSVLGRCQNPICRPIGIRLPE